MIYPHCLIPGTRRVRLNAAHSTYLFGNVNCKEISLSKSVLSLARMLTESQKCPPQDEVTVIELPHSLVIVLIPTRARLCRHCSVLNVAFLDMPNWLKENKLLKRRIYFVGNVNCKDISLPKTALSLARMLNESRKCLTRDEVAVIELHTISY